MPKRQLTGKIISDKMKKTLVVRVERIKEHPKYKRRYRVTKNYKSHDESGEYKIGDRVIIEECKPISKEKKWKVLKKIAPGENETIAEPIIAEEINQEEKTNQEKE